MHGPREKLLADSGLTMDQYGRVQVHDGAERLEDRPHDGALRHHVPEGEALLVAPDRSPVGRLQRLELDRPADHDEQLGRLKGLDEIVLGAQAHRLDRRLDGPVGRHDDDGQIGVIGLDLAHERDPVHAGKPPVGQHQVHVFGLERVEGLFAALDRQHLVTRPLERAVQWAEEHLVVVDQQQPLLHDVPPARDCAMVTAGKETRTRVPRPGALSTLTSPPWRSTIFLTMAMPRPVPEGFVVKNGRKIFSRSSGAMPAPLSMTSTTARSSSVTRLTTTRPSARRGSIASRAFFMTLAKTWRRHWPSAEAATSRSTRP